MSIVFGLATFAKREGREIMEACSSSYGELFAGHTLVDIQMAD